MPPQQVILFIIGTIVILFGAYYVTYFIGMKASGQTRAGLRNRNINLIDRYAIARDKQFCIIEIAGKVYIVGVTNHTMALLDTLDAAAFAELTEKDDENETPWNLTPVGQYGNKLTRKVVAFIAEKTGKTKQTSKVKKTGEPDFAESLKNAERTADSADEKTEHTADSADEKTEHTADSMGEKTESEKTGLSDDQNGNPEDSN